MELHFQALFLLKAYQHIEPLVALSYVRRYFPGATGFFGSWLGVTGTRYFSMREILSLRPLNRLWDGAMCQELGGGFNIFFCSPLLGDFSILTNIFQRGCFNQQLESDGFQLMWLKRLGFWEVTGPIKFFLFDVAKQMVFLQTKVDSVVVSLFVWGWRCSHQRISKEIVQKLGPGSSYAPVN